jgi:hypothetical protein
MNSDGKNKGYCESRQTERSISPWDYEKIVVCRVTNDECRHPSKSMQNCPVYRNNLRRKEKKQLKTESDIGGIEIPPIYKLFE